MKLFVIIFLTIPCVFAETFDRLVVIEAISSSKRSLAIRLGASNNITEGQEVFFSDDNASIRARAVTVTRFESQWLFFGKNTTSPFQAGDMVRMTYKKFEPTPQEPLEKEDEILTEVTNLWDDTPGFTKETKVETDLPLPKRKITSFSIYGYGSYLMNTDRTGQDNIDNGSGLGGTLGFRRFFTPQVSLGLGGHFDRESGSKDQVDYATGRLVFFGEFTYFTAPFDSGLGSWYGGLALGLGQSETTISDEFGDESIKSGSSQLLPELRFGYNSYFSNSSWRWFLQASYLKYRQSETYDNLPDAEKTTTTQFRVSLGIAF